MATTNNVQMSDLENTWRIDSEYYHPSYDALVSKIEAVETVKLAKIAAVADGNHASISEEYQETPGVRYLRGQDISPEMLIDDRNEIFISEETFQRLEASHIFPNDVLVTIVGANTGLVGLVFEPPDRLTANCKLGIARPLEVDAGYLYAFLTSRYGQFQILRAKRGGGQTGLVLFDMRNLLVAKFSEEFEEAVARSVIDAHKHINHSKILLASAERMLLTETGLQDWQPTLARDFLGGYRDVVLSRRIDAQHYQPKYDDLRNQVRSYPHGFRSLVDIAPVSDEKSDPSADPDKLFTYIELASINQSAGLVEGANEILGQDAPSRARMVLQTNDVIASSVEGSLEKVAVITREFNGAIGSTGFFVFRPRTVKSGYFLALVRSGFVREQMRCEASGTILTALSKRSLKSILVPNVPEEIQAEIDAQVQQSHSARTQVRIPMMSTTCSERCRPSNPIDVDHLIRTMPTTQAEQSDAGH